MKNNHNRRILIGIFTLTTLTIKSTGFKAFGRMMDFADETRKYAHNNYAFDKQAIIDGVAAGCGINIADKIAYQGFKSAIHSQPINTQKIVLDALKTTTKGSSITAAIAGGFAAYYYTKQTYEKIKEPAINNTSPKA